MENQITKDARTQCKYLVRKISNVIHDDTTTCTYWFNAEKFLELAKSYDFSAARITMAMEFSEYTTEEEVPSAKTVRRLLIYCEYPDEKLTVGIKAIRRIGKALCGNDNAFLEVIDEESLGCMAEQYLKIQAQ